MASLLQEYEKYPVAGRFPPVRPQRCAGQIDQRGHPIFGGTQHPHGRGPAGRGGKGTPALCAGETGGVHLLPSAGHRREFCAPFPRRSDPFLYPYGGCTNGEDLENHRRSPHPTRWIPAVQAKTGPGGLCSLAAPPDGDRKRPDRAGLYAVQGKSKRRAGAICQDDRCPPFGHHAGGPVYGGFSGVAGTGKKPIAACGS